MLENSAGDSWKAKPPSEEQDWFGLWEHIEPLTEYDKLSVAETIREAMLHAGNDGHRRFGAFPSTCPGHTSISPTCTHPSRNSQQAAKSFLPSQLASRG